MNATRFPINILSGLGKLRRHDPSIPELQNVLEHIHSLYAEACNARLTIDEGDTSPFERSWRKMLVGGNAFVKLQNGEYITVQGFNTKRKQEPSDPSRRCAEERILAELYRRHQVTPIDYVVALVVVGDFQIDDDSGKRCDTLHPCSSCRRKLVVAPFMRDLTLIVTAQPPDERGQPTFAEIHTRDGLEGFHR